MKMLHFVLPDLQLQFENNTALLRIVCHICQSSLGVSETPEHLQLTKKWSLSLEINLQNPFNLPLSWFCKIYLPCQDCCPVPLKRAGWAAVKNLSSQFFKCRHLSERTCTDQHLWQQKNRDLESRWNSNKISWAFVWKCHLSLSGVFEV